MPSTIQHIRIVPYVNQSADTTHPAQNDCHFYVGITGSIRLLRPYEQNGQNNEQVRIATPLVQSRERDRYTFSPNQGESVFNLLIRLHERHRKAEIDADYTYGAPPRFPDIKHWLGAYLPRMTDLF